jgi:flavin reductase (DIM6/NTAB) family NADH-FMN oxidoreductase RutF
MSGLAQTARSRHHPRMQGSTPLEFRAPDGRALVAEVVGDPEAPAVLLLGQGDVLDPVAAALVEAGRNVIRVNDPTAPQEALRTVAEGMRSRPVVVAFGQAGEAAVRTLGEGGEHLATGLVLIDAPAMTDDGYAARIKVPVLIVDGDAALAEPFADAVRASVADPDQTGLADRADALSAVLLDFLERCAPRAVPEYRTGSDPRTLRDALGCFATGVTIVTTLDVDGNPAGLTANSFTSVSLDPPLLLVCLAKSASRLPAFEAAQVFAVNVLHTGQQTVSTRFASKTADRFAGTAWEAWDTGAPIIEHSLASFDCTRHAWHDAGDHVILVGHVQRVRFEPRPPFAFHRSPPRSPPRSP